MRIENRVSKIEDQESCIENRVSRIEDEYRESGIARIEDRVLIPNFVHFVFP